jgi:D-alanyl-D-alanine carboxypeptidase (penicillin-binding protein 5/6)
MVFERLKDGRLQLEDTLPVSKKAWRKGGSKMFVEVGKQVTIDDLLRGIIVHSGNDAAIVVAEGLAGSEDAFAAQMTERARALGLRNSTFKNASGLPIPGHLMSVRDLANLARLLVEQFPEYYHYFGEHEFEFSKIKQQSRNSLLGHVRGADGMKTGFTDEAGYGITASAIRDGRRLVAVLTGMKTPKERAREAERMLDYGFEHFRSYRVVERGQVMEQASVWLGIKPVVPLLAGRDLTVTLTAEARKALSIKLVYDAPLPAPVSEGTAIGHIDVSAPGLAHQVPLVAGATVGQAGLLGRVTSALEYLIFGPGAGAPISIEREPWPNPAG